MVKKVDDYYAAISSQEDSAVPQKKKVVVKKKLKVKAKKPELIQTKADSLHKSASEEIETQVEPASLNDAIDSELKSSFTVISRSDEPKEETSEHYTESSDDFQRVTVADEKKSVKFKPGFASIPASTKKSKKSNQGSDAGTDKAFTRKSKLVPAGKKQKYRNNLGSDDGGFTRSGKMKSRKKEEKKIEDMQQILTTKTGETVTVSDILSIKEFSEKIGVPLAQLIAEFMKNGMMMNINSQVDFDTACLIAESFEVTLARDTSAGLGVSDIASGNIKDLLIEDDSTLLESRAPVVSIMGHVDHGKTSLLDYIRSAKVASGEAGGITQSIGAYQVESGDKKITFLDTPGHEAFTVMRSRGAKSTDIAILVVAADEGVKPQTLESISHAKEAGIPVIVAINKMDKEGANPDHVKGQLAEQGLTPEDWGGETPMVPVSAHTGFGIDDLLDIILLVAEMQDFKANPNRNGVATVIESHLDAKLGPVATVLVNAGTIEKTDAVVCGSAFGKVKLLKDYTGKSVRFVTPGMPALIVGLDEVVEGGDVLQVMSGIDTARQKSTEYKEYLANQKKLKSSQLDILMSRIKAGNLKHLKIVLKADTNGSLEAIKNSLLKLSTNETSVSIIHWGVGNITEGDVLMCDGSNAILVGFGVTVGPNAKSSLEGSGVEYIESKIIYHITERIEKIVTGMLDPKEVEISLCEAKVGGIFYTSKKFMILGLQITGEDTYIEKGAKIRVMRGDKVIGKGIVDSLKQGVEEVGRLEGPIECGIKFVGNCSPEEKDILDIYKVEIQK